MPRHQIVMRTPERLLRKRDVEFAIRVGGELMGTLLISKGSIDYQPAHSQSSYTYPWRKVHELFTRKKWQPTGAIEKLEADVD
ncbi:MAG: hypothetical protein J5I93_14380 [Pirellulaceae bacterium]|nr:hypothetical protein [Pirellulaceae bacterium]